MSLYSQSEPSSSRCTEVTRLGQQVIRFKRVILITIQRTKVKSHTSSEHITRSVLYFIKIVSYIYIFSVILESGVSEKAQIVLVALRQQNNVILGIWYCYYSPTKVTKIIYALTAVSVSRKSSEPVVKKNIPLVWSLCVKHAISFCGTLQNEIS